MKDIVDLIARLLLSFIFWYEAYDSLFYIKETKLKMLEYGLDWNTEILLYGGIFVLILGGLLLLTGYRSGLGVLLLLAYLIPVTFIVHSFWEYPANCLMQTDCLAGTEEYRRLQGILFMKNLAIMGGLLMVWVNGSGRWRIRRLFATTRVK